MKGKKNILIRFGLGAALALILLAVFFVGVFIGRGESRPMHRDFFPSRFGHGAIGIIESLGESTVVVRDRSGALKTVLLDGQTQIRRGHTNTSFSDLKKNEQVIILGEPAEKEGAIKAKLIRVI